MLTITIDLANNEVPKELMDFITNNPAVMTYSIKPDHSKEAKERVIQFIQNMKDDMTCLEEDWLYHESEACGARQTLQLQKDRYKQLQKIFEDERNKRKKVDEK